MNIEAYINTNTQSASLKVEGKISEIEKAMKLITSDSDLYSLIDQKKAVLAEMIFSYIGYTEGQFPKIALIKTCRKVLGVTLKEAKDFVEAVQVKYGSKF